MLYWYVSNINLEADPYGACLAVLDFTVHVTLHPGLHYVNEGKVRVTFGDLRKTATEKDAQEVNLDYFILGDLRLTIIHEIQNRAKITWSMANCIAKDPRRRFVYAFSIENTDMRLWFCDRSKILVSETHNFILVSMSQMSQYYSLTLGTPIRIIYRSYTSSCPLLMHKISI